MGLREQKFRSVFFPHAPPAPLATVTVKSPPDRVILQVILPEEYLLSSKL
jgi:hypothetical protein